MLHIIEHSIIDTIKLIPFLFLAFLIIELLEHKITKKSKKIIAKSNKFGPLLGSILGIFPQCGFSVMATNLYVTRIISIGTLISIYLSTSDEMLLILLSEKVSISIILKILLIKVTIGLISGIIIDLFLRKSKKIKENYEICTQDNCNCGKNNILSSTIKHTINTYIFIFIVTLVLNTLMNKLDSETISKIFLKDNIFAPFISSLIGLIPNCAASVILTELYINNILSLGTSIAGLLTGSGVAILVLFKTNKNIKENFKILLLVYLIGSISGTIINIIYKLL